MRPRLFHDSLLGIHQHPGELDGADDGRSRRRRHRQDRADRVRHMEPEELPMVTAGAYHRVGFAAARWLVL